MLIHIYHQFSTLALRCSAAPSTADLCQEFERNFREQNVPRAAAADLPLGSGGWEGDLSAQKPSKNPRKKVGDLDHLGVSMAMGVTPRTLDGWMDFMLYFMENSI